MGLFITFEGPEGSGKTTQVRLLAAWLAELGHDVLVTREPGGTPIGDAVRALLLDPARTEMRPQTEILLFSAARAQLVGEAIRPHLARSPDPDAVTGVTGRGAVVLCDRFADSTLAYQGYGRELNLDTLRRITAFATGDLTPDLTICLDLPVIEGLRRKRGGDELEWNRMEREPIEFHERVRKGLLHLAAIEAGRWRVVNAMRSAEEIQVEIRGYVLACLEIKELRT